MGGVTGSLCRWVLSAAFDESRMGTLAANLIGVALAGFFLVLMERHGSPVLRHLLLPGFCGGLTTFSAFAYQSVEGAGGFLYFLETLFLSLLIVAVIIPISRRVVPERA